MAAGFADSTQEREACLRFWRVELGAGGAFFRDKGRGEEERQGAGSLLLVGHCEPGSDTGR